MKIITFIQDNKEIKITLTKEQIKEINNQQSKYSHYKDIKNEIDICNVLDIELDFFNKQSTEKKIKLAAKAINSLIKVANDNQYKYYPYFTISSGSLVVSGAFFYFVSSFLASLAYTKCSDSAKYLSNQFLYLYKTALTEY